MFSISQALKSMHATVALSLIHVLLLFCMWKQLVQFTLHCKNEYAISKQ